VTILTSNRTRDLNDAVKRRCLYHWLDYPERERELAIVRARVPQASEALAQQVAQFVGRLRSQPFANAFQRAPGIAESVEWAKALVALDTLVVDPEVVSGYGGHFVQAARGCGGADRRRWRLNCCCLAAEPAEACGGSAANEGSRSTAWPGCSPGWAG
jgi:hypothetical protein